MRMGIGFGIGPLRFYQPLTGGRRRPAPRPTQAQLKAQAEAQKAKEERPAKIALLQEKIKYHHSQADYFKDSPAIRDSEIEKANKWAAMLAQEQKTLENEQWVEKVVTYGTCSFFIILVLIIVLVAGPS